MQETETENAKEPISIYGFIAMLTDQAAAIAWQKLGLHPDMMTGKIERDLAEAKVAIDLVAHLAGVMEPTLDDSDKKEVQNLVSTLRINYVEKMRESD